MDPEKNSINVSMKCDPTNFSIGIMVLTRKDLNLLPPLSCCLYYIFFFRSEYRKAISLWICPVCCFLRILVINATRNARSVMKKKTKEHWGQRVGSCPIKKGIESFGRNIG
jgi:hypothetical protein